jgi:hypothetical protein
METRHAPTHGDPRRLRMRRWLIWLTVAIVLLATYAIALRWFTLHVESGIQASIHPVAVEGQAPAPE